MNDVTVCVTAISSRLDTMLPRALASIAAQLEPPDAVSIAVDFAHVGAGATRSRALDGATTEWVAFLDDDDELRPQHLSTLFATQREHDADVVWPWYDVVGGAGDPLEIHFGRQWVRDEPHSFPITALVRRDLAVKVGGFSHDAYSDICGNEDWLFWLALNEIGARFVHVPERTWIWHHHPGNTSGVPTRW